MNRNLLIIILLLSILISNSVEASQIYLNRNETWGGNLTGVFHSSLVFGDIDNDGDMDMVSSGCTSGSITTCTTAITKVYINNGTSLIENQTWQQNLTGVGLSSLALGDIDNDGDLDLVLAGDKGGFNGTIKVYTNDGSVFNENLTWESNFTDISVIGGSVALGDVNNDGRLDLALVGAFSETQNGIYTNNGTSFNKDFYWLESMPLAGQGYGFGVVAWGDLNGDGFIDLVFSGSRSTNFYVNVYMNNVSSLIENSTWRNGLDTWAWPSIILGDYDNDGDMDLAYIGTHSGDSYYIYNNTGNTFNRGQLIGGLFDGSISWGDYDNDGDLDLASMGKEEGRDAIHNNNFKVFEYDSAISSDFREENMQQGSLTWIDINNDSKLDLACNGYGYGIGFLNKIYTSNSTTPNNIPTPPLSYFNHTFNFSTGKLTLSWGNGSDIETPTLGLYYNLRVGTCSGCHDVVSGIYGGSSNPIAGYFGNMMQRKRIILNRPDLENKTVYWAVQTIDTGLAKSAWSTEQVYHITQQCTENWTYGEWIACSRGQQTRTATDLNSCGTFVNRSAVVQSCLSTPSGGSPAGSSPPPSVTAQNKSSIFENATWYFERINAGVDTGFILNETIHAINQVWIKVKHEVNEVYVDIRKLENKPSPAMKEPAGNVYQYLNITFWNLSAENVELGKIRFNVDKNWIENSSINKSTILLERYFSNDWQSLKTTLNSEDDSNAYYLAETPGFSIFAITGQILEGTKTICIPNEIRCNAGAVEECSADEMGWVEMEKCAYLCENNKCIERQYELGSVQNYLWLLAVAAIIIVAAISAVFKMKRSERIGAN